MDFIVNSLFKSLSNFLVFAPKNTVFAKNGPGIVRESPQAERGLGLRARSCLKDLEGRRPPGFLGIDFGQDFCF